MQDDNVIFSLKFVPPLINKHAVYVMSNCHVVHPNKQSVHERCDFKH